MAETSSWVDLNGFVKIYQPKVRTIRRQCTKQNRVGPLGLWSRAFLVGCCSKVNTPNEKILMWVFALKVGNDLDWNIHFGRGKTSIFTCCYLNRAINKSAFLYRELGHCPVAKCEYRVDPMAIPSLKPGLVFSGNIRRFPKSCGYQITHPSHAWPWLRVKTTIQFRPFANFKYL